MRRFGPINITALALGLAFLYLPIAILVINSFNDSRLVTVWAGWSLRWYRALANDGAMLEAASVSLRIAFLSASAASTGAGSRVAIVSDTPSSVTAPSPSSPASAAASWPDSMLIRTGESIAYFRAALALRPDNAGIH